MKKNTSATVIIYTLILVSLVLIMAVVVLNNTFVLEMNYKYQEHNKLLSDNIKTKASLAAKYSWYVNSNGSGFIDNLSCPDSLTMSGMTMKTTGITSTLVYQWWTAYCEASYNAQPLYIYFDDNYSDYIVSEYQWSSVNLSPGSDKVGVSNFLDSDSTLISFLWSSYLKADGVDDNLNSDNYTSFSTGTIEYPNGYGDDDDEARKIVYWYVTESSWYDNIFWNNTKMEAYIEGNINNSWSSTITLSGAVWYLHLDIDNPFLLKIIRFDKQEYDMYDNLSVLDELEWENLSGGIGYIQDDGSLSATQTGNEYSFDFWTYDYGLFLKNTWSWVLLYQMKSENMTGSWIYINPIDDSYDQIIKYFGWDIIQNEQGQYLSKQFEVVEKK